MSEMTHDPIKAAVREVLAEAGIIVETPANISPHPSKTTHEHVSQSSQDWKLLRAIQRKIPWRAVPTLIAEEISEQAKLARQDGNLDKLIELNEFVGRFPLKSEVADMLGDIYEEVAEAV